MGYLVFGDSFDRNCSLRWSVVAAKDNGRRVRTSFEADSDDEDDRVVHTCAYGDEEPVLQEAGAVVRAILRLVADKDL